MRRIVLAGGSGFLGRALQKDLEGAGYETVVLTRSPRQANDVAWDGKTLSDWASSLEGAFAVVNLAGKSVNCRYTPDNRREIIDSRVDSICVLAAAIATLKTLLKSGCSPHLWRSTAIPAMSCAMKRHHMEPAFPPTCARHGKALS